MDIIEVSNSYKDFKKLSVLYNRELINRFHFNKETYFKLMVPRNLDRLVVGYIEGDPVACGGYQLYDEETIELKNIYVKEDFRQRGYSCKILHSLEQKSLDYGFKYAVLILNKHQKAACNFCKRNNFKVTNNYKSSFNNEKYFLMVKKI